MKFDEISEAVMLAFAGGAVTFCYVILTLDPTIPGGLRLFSGIMATAMGTFTMAFLVDLLGYVKAALAKRAQTK